MTKRRRKNKAVSKNPLHWPFKHPDADFSIPCRHPRIYRRIDLNLLRLVLINAQMFEADVLLQISDIPMARTPVAVPVGMDMTVGSPLIPRSQCWM